MNLENGNALVKAVREHAKRNYSMDGWDYVVESMDSIDIADYLGSHFVKSEAEAIKVMGKYVKRLDDRRKDIQSEVF